MAIAMLMGRPRSLRRRLRSGGQPTQPDATTAAARIVDTSPLGTADWYCSPDARPPDASGSSGNWQDYCGKIYLSMPGASGAGSSVTAVPY